MHAVYKEIDNGYEDSINIWYPVFCIGIRAMNWELFITKVFPKILKMASYESTYVTRNAAANIIIATAIIAAEKQVLEENVLHSYMQLCQDSDNDLRKMALTRLKLVFKFIEPPEIEQLFFGELMTQLTDTNPFIRFIVMDVVFSYQEAVSKHRLEKDFIPLLMKEFSDGWEDQRNWLLQNCERVIKFLMKRQLLDERCVTAITTFFDPILNSKEPDLNKLAIFNFPAIIDMCLTFGLDSSKYINALNELALGPWYQITVLETLSEIINVYHAHDKITLAQPILTILMYNEDQSALLKLMNTLGRMVEKLFSKGKRDQTLGNIFKRDLLIWIKTIWGNVKKGLSRSICSFMESIPLFQDIFSLIEYNEYFLKEVITFIQSGNKIEKQIAATTFCLLYLKNYSIERKLPILKEVLNMGRSINCFERQGLLYLVEAAFDLFSIKFLFENKIVESYLELGKDRVIDVKMKFVFIAKKGVGIIGQREEAKVQFDALLIRLEKDSNKEIKRLAKDGRKCLTNFIPKEDPSDKDKEKQEERYLEKQKEV